MSALKNPRTLVFLLSFIALFLSILVALQTGAFPINAEVWFSMLRGDHTIFTASQHGDMYVLWYLRIPRVMLAVFMGAALGLAGTLVQGLFRNPLADSSLLGVTTGAASAAALTIVLCSGDRIAMFGIAKIWLLPIMSFLGAFLTCMTLNISSKWLAPGSISGLLLLGIALNALGVSIIGLCTYLATDEQLRSLSFWTLGSLAGANWTMVVIMSLLIVLVYACSSRMAQHLNALSLGEVTAAHLGIVVSRLRWSISVMVALLAGLSVAFCGVIGFVGLLAPHLARALIGADQRVLLPLSMVMGALLMLTADTIARTIAIPAEVPVGIFTALLGSPFMIVLLRARRHRIGS
ncbi:FepD ABC-type Fe3+-siderophore transport system, permease component [Burkholderiaceae bacterium]